MCFPPHHEHLFGFKISMSPIKGMCIANDSKCQHRAGLLLLNTSRIRLLFVSRPRPQARSQRAMHHRRDTGRGYLCPLAGQGKKVKLETVHHQHLGHRKDERLAKSRRTRRLSTLIRRAPYPISTTKHVARILATLNSTVRTSIQTF